MAEKITVTIPKGDGDIVFEAKGFKGKGCVSAVEDVIKKLGTVTEQKKTADYHKMPDAKIGVNQ
jgi:hypothetical protein